MARDEKASACAGQFVEEGDHALALHRIQTGQWFVEDEHIRVVDDGGGQLGPLTHAFGERADRFGIISIKIHEPKSTSSLRLSVADTVGEGREGDEVMGRQAVEEGVLLGGETDPTADVAVAAGVLAPAR